MAHAAAAFPASAYGFRPWLVLPLRLVLFAQWQAGFALMLRDWDAAIAWWPLSATLANGLVILLLAGLFRSEGGQFRTLFRIDRTRIGGDLLLMLGFIVVAAPLAYFPNVWLATWLFGSPDIALELFLRPLPAWAAVAAIAFPVSIMLAELPLYFGYAMPRIAAQTGKPSVALVLCAGWLAAQHATLPLIFDGRFVLWRLLMSVPFALFVGLVLLRRPALLPYLCVVHGVLDASIVVMLLQRAA